jgi:hypothetical protein
MARLSLTSGALRNIREYPWICVKKCVRRFLWTFSPVELDENKVIYYERESSRILSYLPRFPLPWSLFAFGLLLLLYLYFVKRGKDVNVSPTTSKFLVVLLLFIMTHIGIFSLLIAGSRYRIPLIPYFFIFGGHAFSTLLEKVEQKNLKQSFLTPHYFCPDIRTCTYFLFPISTEPCPLVR